MGVGSLCGHSSEIPAHLCNDDTANLRTKTLDFRGFDSSIIFIFRGVVLMSMASLPVNDELTNLSRDNVSIYYYYLLLLLLLLLLLELLFLIGSMCVITTIITIIHVCLVYYMCITTTITAVGRLGVPVFGYNNNNNKSIIIYIYIYIYVYTYIHNTIL